MDCNRVLVGFKGARRQCFNNPLEFPIKKGDYLIVEVENGVDLGMALMDFQPGVMSDSPEPQYNVLRRASEEELLQLKENRQREVVAREFCQRKAFDVGLNIHIVDVEYQFDRKKLTFYFVSETRVDFRELVRILAAEYRTRIEMRQIGVRDHAKRLNGVSNCGREICCSRWMNCFEPVNTVIAKSQNLPMNPSKLSGYCGKLKCCLRFEHDFYREILEKCPEVGSQVDTDRGKGTIEKIDVFNKRITIRYSDTYVEELALEELTDIHWDNILEEYEK